MRWFLGFSSKNGVGQEAEGWQEGQEGGHGAGSTILVGKITLSSDPFNAVVNAYA